VEKNKLLASRPKNREKRIIERRHDRCLISCNGGGGQYVTKGEGGYMRKGMDCLLFIVPLSL
jgi:hypothetical protein